MQELILFLDRLAIIEKWGESVLKVFKGHIIFTKEKDRFEVWEHSYLVVNHKKVVGIYHDLPEEYNQINQPAMEIFDYGDGIIIPSFIDLHIHAPQFMQMGIGLDLELIDWLNQYTFMLEQRFADVNYAKKVYPQFVNALYENGTLRSVIYGTIHNDSNHVLVEELEKRGLSAYVGKVNMNQNAPEPLLQEASISIQESKEFILKYRGNELVKPIVTPRFAPSCTESLLKGLGDLSKDFHIPVQTHLSENRLEVNWVKELFPGSINYSSVYRDYGLYGQEKTLMAHAIYLNEDEIEMAKNENIYLVHCPNSNMNLSSGIMPLTQYLDLGLRVGMGSDVGAGHRIGMQHTLTSAIQCSKIRHLMDHQSRILSESEAFYLMTKVNGSFFGKVGSFEPGYFFDALMIKDPDPLMSDLTPLEQLQRFLYCGSSDSILDRYLEGKRI